MNDADIAVLLFGDSCARRRCRPWSGLRRRAIGHLPRPLSRLPVTDAGEIDAAARDNRRLIVVGSDADLAAVLTRLLQTGKLDVEIAFVSPCRSPATRAYRVPAGRRAARRARRGAARRVPLIRDETGSAIVGAAEWRPLDDAQLLHGEAVVDDAVLFDGDAAAVRIEPTAAMPGLRARVVHRRPRRWVAGRAAQLGTTGAAVVRDGVPAARTVRRSTFYRNTEGWLLVR
ncbi:MAG: peptidase M50 [Mycobacterium sp.]